MPFFSLGVIVKTIEELYKFYQQELMADVDELEEERKALAEKVMYILIAVLSPMVLWAAWILLKARDKGMIMFPAVLGIIVAGLIYNFMIRGYKNQFKEKIIKRLVEFIDPGLKYSPEAYIGELEFKRSDLFRHGIDRYKGDDRVHGTVGSTKINFSEIHAEYETRDKDGHRHYHTIFKGLFFIADFNKHFNGRTYVLPDFAEKAFGKMLGGMFQNMNKGRGELVKLEDLDFEKEFAVYGDDQIEARYILSPSLMARIMDFKKKSNKRLYFSFIGSNIYVAIPYTKDLFEPKIFKTLKDFEPIQEYYTDLSLAIGIVEELNLNTRIWTKE